MSNNLYKSKTKKEISYFVNARQKTYLHSTEIYIPNNPYEKIEAGYELSTKKTISGTAQPTSDEEKEERSKRRAYIAVKDTVLSNTFELFATFTFKDRRFNDEESRKKMNGWLKRQRKQDKSFQYVIVPELHKRCEECVELNIWPCTHDDRPKALHFHALIGGYKGKLVRAINPHTGKPLVKGHRKVFDFPTYTLGNSSVYKIGPTEDDHIKSSFYLLKYIRKEMPTFKSKKRYWTSRGLNKPSVVENPQEWYLTMTPDHALSTKFGTYLYFDNDKVDIFLP